MIIFYICYFQKGIQFIRAIVYEWNVGDQFDNKFWLASHRS